MTSALTNQRRVIAFANSKQQFAEQLIWWRHTLVRPSGLYYDFKNHVCICKQLLLFNTGNGNHEHSNSNRLTHVPVVSKFFLLFDLMRWLLTWTMNIRWGLFSKISQIIGWFGQMGGINCGVFPVDFSAHILSLCVSLVHDFSLLNHYFNKKLRF